MMMMKCVRCIVFIFLFRLFPAAVTQQVCNNDTQAVPVVYNATARLDCGSGSTHRWWRSNNGCMSFEILDACTDQLCRVNVNSSIERFFHYCCSDGDATQLNLDTRIACFHVQVCTHILGVSPPVIVSGRTERIYVEMRAEPQPNRTTFILELVIPGGDSMSFPPLEEAFALKDTALNVFVYTFDVPELDSINDAMVEFRVSYDTVGICLGTTRDLGEEIPVVMGTSITPPPEPTATTLPATTSTATPQTTQPPTGPVPTAMSCPSSSQSNDAAFVAALAVLSIATVLIFVALIVVVIFCLYMKRRSKSASLQSPPAVVYTYISSTATTPATPGTQENRPLLTPSPGGTTPTAQPCPFPNNPHQRLQQDTTQTPTGNNSHGVVPPPLPPPRTPNSPPGPPPRTPDSPPLPPPRTPDSPPLPPPRTPDSPPGPNPYETVPPPPPYVLQGNAQQSAGTPV